MSAQPQWQFVGNVPENYERYLVPSIFGPWAKDLVEFLDCSRENAFSTSPAGPESWRGPRG
jgi:hypothetical protein